MRPPAAPSPRPTRALAPASASARLWAAARSTAQRLEAARARVRILLEENGELRVRNEDLERLNLRLARLSVTDELTGLPNHRSFRDSLSREIKRALRDESALALVLFDVDDFKGLNDDHGHAVGDAILSRVAGVMRGGLREVDLLARYGGEEFALLAPGTSLVGAVAIAEKIRLAVSQAVFSVITLEGPRSLRVSVSAGVALFDGCERRLFNGADRALYAAKSAGKDCVQTAE
jgi:diguanylate cyclase (GGDEF)-like protein